MIAAIFVVILGGFGKGEVTDYLRDSQIRKDPGEVSAQIVDHEEITKRRRRRTTTSYNITYAFDAQGKQYTGTVSMGEEAGLAAMEIGTLDIVYSKSQPAIHALKRQFGGGTLSDLIVSLVRLLIFALVVSPIVGVILAWKFGWLKKRELAAAGAA